MNWFQRLLTQFLPPQPEQKESQAMILASMPQVGKAQTTPRDYKSFSKEGYEKNVMVYQAVQKIVTACSSIEWNLYQKSRSGEPTEVIEHPLLTLIQHPNPMQGWAAFVENVIGFYSISGNTYIQSTKLLESGPPLELYTLRPDRMTVIPGSNGFPQAYKFQVGQDKLLFPVDVKDERLESEILHIKTFHPTNDWYGLSPIEPAILAIDQHNEAGIWNIGLLQNQARPSGVLSVGTSDVNPTGALDDEQYGRLKQMLDQQYTGKNNAGRPMLLEGGLKWDQISLSPQQMDFLENKNVSSRDIALAFGVPPLLLNIGSDNTFANYKEARIAFYEDTILNIMNKLRDELNNWLTPQFGEDLYLEYDKDSISALTEKRMMLFETVQDNKELTVNEKRELLGYDTVDGLDVFVFSNSDFVVDANEPDFSPPVPPTSSNDSSDQSNEDSNTTDQEPEPGQDADDEEKSAKTQDSEIENKSDEQLLSEVKLFRPVNEDERRQVYVRQNLLMERHEKRLYKDTDRLFKNMINEMADLADSIDPSLWEYSLYKVSDRYEEKFAEAVLPRIKTTVEVFGNEIIKQVKFHPNFLEHKAKPEANFQFFVNSWIKTRTGDLVKKINETNKKQIKSAIKRVLKEKEEYEFDENYVHGESKPFNVVKTITEKLQITRSRAQTIARTETGIAATQGTLKAAEAMEIDDLEKEWLSVQDSRVRDDAQHADHKSMNGDRVALNEKFLVAPGAEMDGPRDPGAPAEQVINCRCTVIII